MQCGAFDSLHEPHGITRARAFAAIDTALERGKTRQRRPGERPDRPVRPVRRRAGRRRGDATGHQQRLPASAAWERKDLLKREKGTLGFYVSGHPLDGYQQELKRFCNATTASVSGCADGTQVTLGGMIEDFRVRSTKTGGKIGFFQFEDPFGRTEVVVREKALDANRELLSSDAPVLITGLVREDRDYSEGGGGEVAQNAEKKLLLDSVSLLVDAFRLRTRAVRVRVDVERIDRQKLVDLRRALEDFPGSCPVTLQLVSNGTWHVTMPTRKIMVDPTEAMLARLELLFGEKVCELR